MTGELAGRGPLDDIIPQGWGNEQTVKTSAPQGIRRMESPVADIIPFCRSEPGLEGQQGLLCSLSPEGSFGGGESSEGSSNGVESQEHV